MKSNLWDIAAAGEAVIANPGKRRRKSIVEILRAAYRATTRDTLTRRAVKRVLR